ncbi:HNH endonuclease [Hymenobacter fodinae]|uniref:HNH domain-containing protein n=1 Tax=Hymenobacter fodinae TaxID=2510796 RepID=A0A4Z0P0E3_9BACT|nr:HNH endonuclease [Hymenobacter fodinae]TGE04616.1 hypothetical protein EU556_20745 [Hymenobacter fodinae]
MIRRLRLWWKAYFRRYELRHVTALVDQYREPSGRVTAEFYRSWEWHEVRYDFLRSCKNRLRCWLCRRQRGDRNEAGDAVRLVVDHIYPVSRYPHLALDTDNLQLLCNDCNRGKSNRHTHDYR